MRKGYPSLDALFKAANFDARCGQSMGNSAAVVDPVE